MEVGPSGRASEGALEREEVRGTGSSEAENDKWREQGEAGTTLSALTSGGRTPRRRRRAPCQRAR